MLTWVERKTGWFIVTLVLIILGMVVWSLVNRWQHTTTVNVGRALISAAIASTDETRAKGLGGRQKLGTNEGMLLVYGRDDRWGIWMKDMKLAIDIIWINKDKRVVHITKNVYPDTYPEVFQPDTKARYVLEVPAGTVDREKININQTARFELPKR
ncbi:protein of unknown function DUF192 [candidate division TM7 genomosp. GTL1]|nr:protein of unknown function DUF192 [candidate division TM7 genomosp. GTL1]